MKKFIRSYLGKTVLYILTLILACTFALSAAGIIIMAKSGMYSQDKESFVLKTDIETFDSIAHDTLQSLMRGICYRSSDSRNVIYRITDDSGNILDESDGLSDDFSSWDYESFYFTDSNGHVIYSVDRISDSAVSYHGYFAVDDTFPYNDNLKLAHRLIDILYSLKVYAFIICALSFITGMICLTALMTAAGHRPGTDNIVPGYFTKIPLDLLIFLSLCLGGILVAITTEAPDTVSLIICICTTGFTGLAVGIGLMTTIAVRVKLGTIWRNNVLSRLFKLCMKLISFIAAILKDIFTKLHGFACRISENINMLYKVIICCAAVIFTDLLLIVTARTGEFYMLCNFIFKFILSGVVIYIALCLLDLQKAGKEISSGNSAYTARADYRFLPDLNEHAKSLNSISEGITDAVNERLKSERMKTELITNVSHDIKTPLTSIINYAGLIQNEPAGSSRISEYSEVLVRQSVKLKRLLEDIVEVSKASTGNLDCSPVPCDPAVFISQISGEYEDKLHEAGLTLVTKYEEDRMKIMADGRRMWRVFDNLMNNICKYSLSGTRVYIDLENNNGNACITLKNTSRDELNISESELMERFVRGDSSRNTEGNGLGLSIADSLIKLQGGEMKITIDGDLFKTVLVFPLINE